MVEAEVHAPGARRLLQADAAMSAVILALGLFLAGTGNALAQHWRSSSARQQSLGFEGQLGIVANTAGLIVTVWWMMSLAIAVAAAVLERRGCSRAASAAGAFAPAFMRRLALAAVGLQLLTAQLATAAVPPVPDAPTAPPALAAAWAPTAVPTAAPTAVPTAAPAPAPPADVDPRWKVSSPVVEPGLLAGGRLRSREPAEEGTEVTVRAGDSLWSLAAARLGPFASDVDVAREWPRLYQANREVIGGSPHLLQPGMVLRFPSGS
ncbi:hypothetical protein BJG92_01363 [Arthrobacter sp. SO5]|nr:hypothetical protein [Arthrobacter sp. SO5]